MKILEGIVRRERCGGRILVRIRLGQGTHITVGNVPGSYKASLGTYTQSGGKETLT